MAVVRSLVMEEVFDEQRGVWVIDAPGLPIPVEAPTYEEAYWAAVQAFNEQ